jgi:hypothetical protein
MRLWLCAAGAGRKRRMSRRARRPLRASIDVSATCDIGRPLSFTVRGRVNLLHLAATVALFAASNVGEASDRPTGTNCNLSAPPAASGEDYSHGITVRIYPRAKDIGPTYSGCQVMWAQNVKGWSEIAVTLIEHGDAVRIWSSDLSDPARFSCRYQHGRVISGHPETCADPGSLIFKSMAPGCVAKRLAAVAKANLGAPPPQGCDYE